MNKEARAEARGWIKCLEAVKAYLVRSPVDAQKLIDGLRREWKIYDECPTCGHIDKTERRAKKK